MHDSSSNQLHKQMQIADKKCLIFEICININSSPITNSGQQSAEAAVLRGIEGIRRGRVAAWRQERSRRRAGEHRRPEQQGTGRAADGAGGRRRRQVWTAKAEQASRWGERRSSEQGSEERRGVTGERRRRRLPASVHRYSLGLGLWLLGQAV